MKKKLAVIMLLTILAGVSVSAQLPAARKNQPEPKDKKMIAAAPDLRISEYIFTLPKDDSDVKVYVLTEGNGGQGGSTSRNASTFALVATRFKNGGGNYDHNFGNSDKFVLVHVMNAGNAATTPCRLMLTVRKINGIPANRQKVATVPALEPDKDTWVLIDASSILPNSVGLETTSFKLNVDATNLLHESNESNNEALHNQ
jgi:hypothetical protein